MTMKKNVMINNLQSWQLYGIENQGKSERDGSPLRQSACRNTVRRRPTDQSALGPAWPGPMGGREPCDAKWPPHTGGKSGGENFDRWID